MRIADLFCGCGGMSLGFQLADHEIAIGIDFWDSALAVYEANFNHPALKIDLSKIEEAVPVISAFHPQMIIGGPPCQDFSSAGKRNEDNGRGDLTVYYAKIISGRFYYLIFQTGASRQNLIKPRLSAFVSCKINDLV